jgi:type IV pilus assembly protein PilM
MSDSMWKKEISFGKKKPKPQATEPVVEQAAAPEAPTSFLKKEISFGKKKPKAAEAPAAAPVQQAAAPEAPTSFLKKEISFGRKAKAPKQPKAQGESFLKKEISFGRKKHDREVERLAHEAAQVVAPVEVAPVAAPPTAIAEAVVAAMPEPVAPVYIEPVAVAPVVAEVPAPVEPVALAAVPDVSFVEHVSDPELPVAEVPAEPEPAPAPVVPDTVSTLSPAILAASAEEPVAPVAFEPVPVVPEPVAYEPVPVAPEPVAYEPAPAPAESWLAEPALPPAPVAPEPVVVHPPVPAAELPPLPAVAAKVPFWKKELGGTKKAKEPKAPKEKAAATSTPFWKKELGGKKKQATAGDAPTEQLPVAKPKSEPFWKKEIGGKKKAKEPKAPKAPKEKAAASTPFWKKEIGGKKKATSGDAPTEQLPVAKPKSEPFWKKQIGAPKASSSKRGSSSSKTLVGLKIGASQLAAARVSNNGVASLQQLARDVLPPGVVVGGELRDPDALAESLKAFFARHKLPKKGVRLGIASNRIGVRIFDIVGVDDEKQLANAIQFRAQEALPIPLDEAVLDYRVLDERTNDEGVPVKRVLLVVAYRELVERYVDACKRAGITLAGIDLEAFAMLRALAAPADPGNSALVAVAIGHDRSTFAVSDGRVCEFTRVLEWGGWSLNVALARAFDSAPSEVEAIKRSISLDGTVVPAGLTEEQTALALDTVRRQVQSFARELVSSLQFYQNQPGSLGIGEIVLTGGTAHLPGLGEELQRLIGVRVRVGDPLARLKVAKKIGEMDQIGSLAVAIGLGIED